MLLFVIVISGEHEKSASEKERDTKPNEPVLTTTVSDQPYVNDKGEWELSMYDVDCLAVGAGILGCGGGGSPYLGWLSLKEYLKKGKPRNYSSR